MKMTLLTWDIWMKFSGIVFLKAIFQISLQNVQFTKKIWLFLLWLRFLFCWVYYGGLFLFGYSQKLGLLCTSCMPGQTVLVVLGNKTMLRKQQPGDVDILSLTAMSRLCLKCFIYNLWIWSKACCNTAWIWDNVVFYFYFNMKWLI